MSAPIAIDLFCGAGGLTVGLKKAGFKVIAGVELAKPAIDTYRLNHKKHKLYTKDIRELSPSDLMADLNIKVGQLDLLAGCPPCQGFSTHRTRNRVSSIEDERNELVFEYLKFVEVLLPKTVMMENVPGLARDRRIESVKNKLKLLGYHINDMSVQVKDAADYGVPQRRHRMILLASRFGYIQEPKKVKTKKTVRKAISNLPEAGKSGDLLHDWLPKRSPEIKKMISLIPKNGGSRKDLPIEYWLPCHIKRPDSYTDVYGRMSWDHVAPTITGGCDQPSKGRYIHPYEDRGVTFREAALLQTFPRNYKFTTEYGKSSVALMIGNALPPLFIKKHASMIRNHLVNLDNGSKNGI